jgi:chromosome partitioning protein
MRREVAVVNPKPGTGRSAVTVNLAAALGMLGESVLVVDLNARARTSLCYGLEDEGATLLRCLTGPVPTALSVRPTDFHGVDLVPGGPGLEQADALLRAAEEGHRRLRASLDQTPGSWDWVFLDCPSGLGPRVVNALVAARRFLVPVGTHVVDFTDLGALLGLVEDIRSRGWNADLGVLGVLPCMGSPADHGKLHLSVAEALESAFPGKVCASPVRSSPILAEARRRNKPVRPGSRAAADYTEAARWLVSMMP